MAHGAHWGGLAGHHHPQANGTHPATPCTHHLAFFLWCWVGAWGCKWCTHMVGHTMHPMWPLATPHTHCQLWVATGVHKALKFTNPPPHTHNKFYWWWCTPLGGCKCHNMPPKGTMALAWPNVVVVHPIAAPPWALCHGGPWHQVCTFVEFWHQWGCWWGVLVPQTKCPLCLCPPPHNRGWQWCPTTAPMGTVVALPSIAPTCTHLHL